MTGAPTGGGTGGGGDPPRAAHTFRTQHRCAEWGGGYPGGHLRGVMVPNV